MRSWTAPSYFGLIADAQAGDMLLIEQVDRLSRLKMDDWQRLKGSAACSGCRSGSADIMVDGNQLRR